MSPEPEYPYYPPWLEEGYFHFEFDWESAWKTTFADFLRAYTLHDSSWIDLRVDTQFGGEATLVFRFDALWTEGRVPHPGSAVADWPILLIRLPRVQSVTFEGYSTDRHQRTVSSAESFFLAPGEMRTVIRGVYDEIVTLDHEPSAEILCIDRWGAHHALD